MTHQTATTETFVKPTGPLVYRIDDACMALQISRPTLYRYINLGIIGYVDIGGIRRIPVSEVERIVNERQRKG